MKNVVIYRGAFVILGIILLVLLTQFSMGINNSAKTWIMVVYIVVGGAVTEILRKTRTKKTH